MPFSIFKCRKSPYVAVKNAVKKLWHQNFSGSVRLAQTLSSFGSTKIRLGFRSNVFRLNFCGFGSGAQVYVVVRTLGLATFGLGSNSQPWHFWDRWPYFAGKLSLDITTTQVNSALHPSGVDKSSTISGWGKGGWQVTLCDPILHVNSYSCEVIPRTVISDLLTYFTCCSKFSEIVVKYSTSCP